MSSPNSSPNSSSNSSSNITVNNKTNKNNKGGDNKGNNKGDNKGNNKGNNKGDNKGNGSNKSNNSSNNGILKSLGIDNLISGNSSKNNLSKNKTSSSPIDSNSTNTMGLSTKMFSDLPKTLEGVQDSLSDAKDNIVEKVDNVVEVIVEKQSFLFTVIKVLIMVGVIIAVIYVGKYFYQKMKEASIQNSTLLDGTKNGKHALVITQDPMNPSYIPINRSDEKDGIQFTYNFWFLIESMDYKTGEWKHIFHKGNASSYPNRAPGVWIHPTKNIVRIYMNTQSSILEYVDIDNIPIRKWVNMSIVLNNKNLDIYVNGYLKTRKELTSLPKQNDDNFWVNMFGGFEGYVSNIKYYAYMIDFTEMDKLIRDGPSKDKCIDSSEVPPYLDDNWWYNSSRE
jgi:hypothetical protein